MKKKGISIMLVVALMMTASTVTSFGATYGPAAPKTVSVKNIDDNYLKVSWSNSKTATKYAVYRSTSKYGSYKKLTTTKYRYYRDKTVKNKTRYYYKVKALNRSGKLSKYSAVRSGRIAFNGKVIVEKNSWEISVGQSMTIPLEIEGTDDSLIACFDDHLDVEFITLPGDSEALNVVATNGMFSYIHSDITLVFEKHEKHYAKNVEIVVRPYVQYYNFKGTKVPDFGKGFWVEPSFTHSAAYTMYAYDYSDILAKGHSISNVISAYRKALVDSGFAYYGEFIESSTNTPNYEYRKGNTVVYLGHSDDYVNGGISVFIGIM